MTDEVKPIRCYVSPASGRNKIADWYHSLSSEERADADEFVKNMRKTKDWSMPNYRQRLRTYKFGELRWTSRKRQHRLLGYLKAEEYFALVGCTHKQRIYDPANALETADTRKKEIESGKAGTVPYEL
jgi:hypothetical protein